MDDASLNALKSRLEQGRRSLAAQPTRTNVEEQLLQLHEAVRVLLAETKRRSGRFSGVPSGRSANRAACEFLLAS
jgi:hypothetical protein